MVLQAFVDDSKTERGNFVLSGYVGAAQEWAAFSAEWEPLVRKWGILMSDGSRVFKMAEMRWRKERMERVAAFYRVIENHDLQAFSIGMNRHSYRRALRRLSVPGVPLDGLANGYQFLFFCLVSNLVRVVHERADLFLAEDKIDFYFDEQAEKTAIRREWNNFVGRSDSDFRSRLGNEPRFEREQDLLPLQAADFWAWWNSHWLDTGRVGFEGHFEVHRHFSSANHFATEDHIVEILRKIIRRAAPRAAIYEHKLAGGDKR